MGNLIFKFFAIALSKIWGILIAKIWGNLTSAYTQKQRIAFLATTNYIEKNGIFDEENYKDWMRFVWNIISDPFIRSVPAMINAIKFVNDISEHSHDILAYLRDDKALATQYKTQFNEECIKSKLISFDSDFKEEIIKAESHKLFKGSIRFILNKDENTTLNNFKQNTITAFKIFGAIGKEITNGNEPKNYLWVRAMLTKATNIKLPITLSNGRDEEWRALINGQFIEAIRLLIFAVENDVSNTTEDALKNICNNYQQDVNLFWVYPLVNWTGNNGETLLGNYSVTRKIQRYNNYGNDPEHVYLYNQTRWTEGNIIISNNRNEIVSELLKNYNDIKPVNDWSNIQNSFFRGWNVQLERKVGDLNFTYILDKVFIRVGIKLTLELEEQFKNFTFNDNNKEQDWICRLKYDYTQIEQKGIKSFIEKIENDVFDDSNPESLINKIKL